MEAKRKEMETDLFVDVFFTNMLRGRDGDTPLIGENGNWWVGGEDTGVRARARDGEDGYTNVIVSRSEPEGKRKGTIWIKVV